MVIAIILVRIKLKTGTVTVPVPLAVTLPVPTRKTFLNHILSLRMSQRTSLRSPLNRF